jgi:hypothetical protein
MFLKNRLPKIKPDILTPMEKKIIHIVAENVEEYDGARLIKQIDFLPKIRRIKYKNDRATELYPQNMDSIPNEFLFNKKDEFVIAKMSFKHDRKLFTSKITMVLGSIFEIQIKPIPQNNDDMIKGDFLALKVEIIDPNNSL